MDKNTVKFESSEYAGIGMHGLVDMSPIVVSKNAGIDLPIRSHLTEKELWLTEGVSAMAVMRHYGVEVTSTGYNACKKSIIPDMRRFKSPKQCILLRKSYLFHNEYLSEYSTNVRKGLFRKVKKLQSLAKR